MVKGIAGNCKKDFLIEFRNRSAVNISISFAVITILAVSLSTGGIQLSSTIQSILFWIILFFSGMNGLSHIFIREEEQETSLFLRLNSSPETVFVSKLIYNILVFLLLQILITPLFIFFFQVVIQSLPFFMITVFAGGFSIAASVTILAAMVAKAGGKGALFTVISFPIILPVLWVCISATSRSIDNAGVMEWNNIIFLLAFSGAIIAVSYLLFEYVWIEE